MFEINWVQIGVGFIVGVIGCYLVYDLVFPVSNKDE
jgi:hypothetical protein